MTFVSLIIALFLCATPLSYSIAVAKSRGFHHLALRINTDKVTGHQYHHLYEKYLGSRTDESLRLLEVGLGCGMPYGPGHSLQVQRLSTFPEPFCHLGVSLF